MQTFLTVPIEPHMLNMVQYRSSLVCVNACFTPLESTYNQSSIVTAAFACEFTI